MVPRKPVVDNEEGEFFMRIKALFYMAGAFIIACQPQAPEESGDAPQLTVVSVTVAGQTVTPLADGATDPAILIDADNPANSLILGAGLAGGLGLYQLDGTRIGVMPDRPIGLVDVRYNFPFADDDINLILAYDDATTELVAYRLDETGNALIQISSQPILTKMEVEGLCAYQSPLTGKFYAFAAGEGMIQQWELHESEGDVLGRKIRTVPVGLGAGHCVAHDREAAIYYSQETVGVWRLPAEPESEAEAELIDLADPLGRFAGDVKGVAVVEMEAGGYLLVSDADVNLLHVYKLDSHDHVGAFSVAASAFIGAAQEMEGIAATAMPLSGRFGNGLLVLANDNSDANNANYKFISWGDVSAALNLPGGVAYNPTVRAAPPVIIVSPSVETTPVQSFGDAADDPAIWIHPERPELSTVIGSQKQHGINVYDLEGNLLQSRADGRINNVDLRYGFSLGGESIDIVTGSNRSSDSISIYAVDPKTRTLVDVADGVIPTGMSDPYGQCMYKSPLSGEFYVYINDTSGIFKQWLLKDAGNGRVGVELVREFNVGSQPEGCVADDATGDLYVGEEGVALWKYSAEPDGNDQRTMVDSIEDGHLAGDIEGMAIYYGPGESGYLVVSDQGINSFALYQRGGDNAYLGHFHVVADASTGIDGVSETDGLDVTSAYLGPAFPHGVFVAQDGRNITPAERQNFKLVQWERIAAVMGLESHSGYDPRLPAE